MKRFRVLTIESDLTESSEHSAEIKQIHQKQKRIKMKKYRDFYHSWDSEVRGEGT